MRQLRVVLCDDHALVRRGFRLLLEAHDDVRVVGEAGSGEEVLALDAAADVVVLDLMLPGMDGAETTSRLLDRPGPPPAVLVVSGFGGEQHAVRALRAGASGFVRKDSPPDGFVDAVRAVARGDTLVAPPDVLRPLLARPAPGRAQRRGDAALAVLTSREREVLGHVVRGLSNEEIAVRLGVEEGTVKSHVSRMLTKLGLRSRVQAVVLAYETGLLVPGWVTGAASSAAGHPAVREGRSSHRA